MSLKDDLLPLVDELRGIPGELGFRPYQVWVRKTVYAGPRVGIGASSVTETRLLVGGQDPKVREIRRHDEVAGSLEAFAGEYEIGPLTPEFATGGISEDTINPEKTSTPTAVTFLIKGSGLPDSGILCQRISESNDKSLRTVIRVKNLGRTRPV